jgi:hypothetical protein
LYIAQIIFQEAKRVEAEMTKVPAPLDVNPNISLYLPWQLSSPPQ